MTSPQSPAPVPASAAAPARAPSPFVPVDPDACRGCGCTADQACAGGCWWADQDLSGEHGGPLCSRCAVETLATYLHEYGLPTA